MNLPLQLIVVLLPMLFRFRNVLLVFVVFVVVVVSSETILVVPPKTVLRIAVVVVLAIVASKFLVRFPARPKILLLFLVLA